MFAEGEEAEDVVEGGEEHPLRREASSSMAKGRGTGPNHGGSLCSLPVSVPL